MKGPVSPEAGPSSFWNRRIRSGTIGPLYGNQETLLIKAKFILPILIALAGLAVLAAGCSSEEQPAPPQPPAPAAPAQPAVSAQPVQPSAPQQPEQPAAAAAAAPAVQPPAPQPPAQPAQPPAPRQISEPAATFPTATFPLTVLDNDGNEVVFEEPPKRIVAFDSAVVEMLFAMGEGHRVIATHDFVSYPPEADDITRVGNAFDMDIESTVALEPDLVYVFFDRFVEDLERAGLKVLYIPTLSDDFAKVADNIRMWGLIVGNPKDAEMVALEFEAKLGHIEEALVSVGAGPTVFQDAGSYWTPGSGTLMQEVFNLLRLENIAADIEGYAQISPEVIVERDPHIIITSSPDTLLGEPALAEVWAVKHEAFYTPSSDALSIPGPRFIDGVDELARWVYPGLFR